jgi:hypothetical protein
MFCQGARFRGSPLTTRADWAGPTRRAGVPATSNDANDEICCTQLNTCQCSQGPSCYTCYVTCTLPGDIEPPASEPRSRLIALSSSPTSLAFARGRVDRARSRARRWSAAPAIVPSRSTWMETIYGNAICARHGAQRRRGPARPGTVVVVARASAEWIPYGGVGLRTLRRAARCRTVPR